MVLAKKDNAKKTLRADDHVAGKNDSLEMEDTSGITDDSQLWSVLSVIDITAIFCFFNDFLFFSCDFLGFLMILGFTFFFFAKSKFPIFAKTNF